jgi:hypothetical protein
MAQVIIYKNDKGGVSICNPHPDHDINWVKEKDTPGHAIIVDEADLPFIHDDFFDAWELVNGQVTIHHGKATDITKERLRRERASLLQAQDVAFQRAIENSADTSAIVAEKQRLRDITKLADSATTIEELKALKALKAGA